MPSPYASVEHSSWSAEGAEMGDCVYHRQEAGQGNTEQYHACNVAAL